MCVLIYVYKECVYHFKLLFSATISNSVVDVFWNITFVDLYWASLIKFSVVEINIIINKRN